MSNLRNSIVDESPAWAALTDLASAPRSLRIAFERDTRRAKKFTVNACDLRVDFSKNLIDDSVVRALLGLAARVGVEHRIEAMFRGDPINSSENRPALHTALRAPRGRRLVVAGEDVNEAVHSVLDRMRRFAGAIRGQTWLGSTGEPIHTVVNIGIGGSDLGPAMATRALSPFASETISSRFVSNIDPADLLDALRGADAATTLFIVASKTFTTIETMTNATAAREWVIGQLGADADVSKHFVAVSTNSAGVSEFGIDPANMFEFWDWVGGRYSLCSAIGLSLMVAIGADGFDEMLAGFHAMDQHFATTPLGQNGPAVAGLIAVWNRNFLGMGTHAVLPYSQHLSLFPAYLQQLDMESNGKSVRADGEQVGYDTGPVLWGEPGTNGQHAFYQLLHQGTSVVPADLIGFLRPVEDLPGQHQLLFANMVAQAEALAFGRTEVEVEAVETDQSRVPHRTFAGNRPTTTIVAPMLTPHVLGQLVAFYEHRTFTQGAIWGINSFDQWGVELGKELATVISVELDAPPAGARTTHDSSTTALIELYRNSR